jgi:ABC-type glycerol-3-phosphate transport system permease component
LIILCALAFSRYSYKFKKCYFQIIFCLTLNFSNNLVLVSFYITPDYLMQIPGHSY